MDLTAKEFMEWKEAMDFGDSFMTHSLAMVLVTWKTLRAEDYGPEFEKLNHNEILGL